MLDSRKRANEKWLAKNYESITIRVPKGTREKIKEWADADGLSMAAYIQQACKEKSEKVEKVSDRG
jgi:predicted DNA binding CopG/RHH family protein